MHRALGIGQAAPVIPVMILTAAGSGRPALPTDAALHNRYGRTLTPASWSTSSISPELCLGNAVVSQRFTPRPGEITGEIRGRVYPISLELPEPAPDRGRRAPSGQSGLVY